MKHQLLLPRLKPHGLLLYTGLVLANCHGTEGDNPFAGTIDPSPCKGEEDYASFLRQRVGAEFLQPTRSASPGSANYATRGQALVARSDMPVGLECLEWELTEEKLELAISNFAGGCAVAWDGSSTLENPGKLVLKLSNPSCSVAGCGWCFYDTDATFEANVDDLLNGDQDSLELELELRDCDGEVTKTYVWQVPLRAREQGIVCNTLGSSWVEAYNNAATSESFSETQLNLYAECAPDQDFAVVCTEDRMCVDGKCLPPCETDADCPLSGALTCQDRVCKLVE